jgi:hypothetical protein
MLKRNALDRTNICIVSPEDHIVIAARPPIVMPPACGPESKAGWHALA